MGVAHTPLPLSSSWPWSEPHSGASQPSGPSTILRVWTWTRWCVRLEFQRSKASVVIWVAGWMDQELGKVHIILKSRE